MFLGVSALHTLTVDQSVDFSPSPTKEMSYVPEVPRWCLLMAETCALLDAILAVVHPELWLAGYKTMKAIKCSIPDGSAIPSASSIRAWPSVYTGVHAICNRASLYHRDTNGRPSWFDMLLSVGTYGQKAVLAWRNLGFSVPYDSGSLCFLSSSIVHHGVPHVSDDRLCLAFLMDDTVHHFNGVEGPGWSR